MFHNRKKKLQMWRNRVLKSVNLGIFYSFNECMLYQVAFRSKRIIMSRCAISLVFRKNSPKVNCKDILFLILNVLNSGEFVKSHLNCFIPDSPCHEQYLVVPVGQYLICIYKKDNLTHEVFQRF